MRRSVSLCVFFAAAAIANAQGYGRGHAWWDAGQGGYLTQTDIFDNSDGQVTLVNRKGAVLTQDHPFFEALGSNGRACVTCHQPADALSVSPATLRQRWNETSGKDPVFAAIDGSNCPDLPQDRASSHSLLLERGLFRIFLPWPPKAPPEFRLEVVHDPNGCNTNRPYVSVYRRPRIPANLDQVVSGPDGLSFMADGREPTLESQATSAILVHEQASGRPSAEQLRRIVEFETQLYMAQSADVRAGLLNDRNAPAILGPQNLATGRAGTMGQPPAELLRMFDAWRLPADSGGSSSQAQFRASVARGGDVFFTRAFRDGGASVTCASCHAHGMTRWMDIGTANTADPKDAPDLPMFRITCEKSGQVVYTHDPGRALVSGRCADVGAVVLGQIRGLAARAPYFSNGSARTLRELVNFYDRRFAIGYSDEEKRDLVNFLLTL